MSNPSDHAQEILERALESNRIHSSYLLTGPGEMPRQAALNFARALVCAEGRGEPCEACSGCRRSTQREEVTIDGAGKKGPLFRHIGDHPDLIWVERGPDDTRVRIGQVRAVQSSLRLRSNEGGRRAVVIADADWLNVEAQNALLRLLEEPPEATTLILVAKSSAGLLVTVRSRCQRLLFRDLEAVDGEAENEETAAEIRGQLDQLSNSGITELLDWAEQYRGERAVAAAGVTELLEVASLWLRDRVRQQAAEGDAFFNPELAAFATLNQCRKALVQRNANPQMMAERALLSLREAVHSAAPGGR